MEQIIPLMASILFWKVVFSTVMFDITMEMLPRMAAKMRTPTRKSPVTKRSSVLFLGSGCGVSPMVVRVRVDQ